MRAAEHLLVGVDRRRQVAQLDLVDVPRVAASSAIHDRSALFDALEAAQRQLDEIVPALAGACRAGRARPPRARPRRRDRRPRARCRWRRRRRRARPRAAPPACSSSAFLRARSMRARRRRRDRRSSRSASAWRATSSCSRLKNAASSLVSSSSRRCVGRLGAVDVFEAPVIDRRQRAQHLDDLRPTRRPSSLM